MSQLQTQVEDEEEDSSQLGSTIRQDTGVYTVRSEGLVLPDLSKLLSDLSTCQSHRAGFLRGVEGGVGAEVLDRKAVVVGC